MRKVTESEIIHYLKFGRLNPKQVVIPIGDDAALLELDNTRVVICKDISVEGTHFLRNTDPFNIARRSVLVNVSDLAAMAAIPKYILLGLTLPTAYANEKWVKRFSKGLHSVLDEFDMHLIGGDVTKGKLNVSVTLIGEEFIESRSLKRSDMLPDDNIYVTGTLGDAAAGLKLLKSKTATKGSDYKYLVDRYIDPNPRIELAKRIAPFARGVIDVSDGLLNELQILSKQSNCGVSVDTSLIPTSKSLRTVAGKNFIELALNGGDDYEILFAAPPSEQKAIEKISQTLKLPISLIGTAVSKKGININGLDSGIKIKSFRHF